MEGIHVPDAWLNRVGFKLGNPFSTREASREPEPGLVNYFIQHPSFDDVLGNAANPISAFLVARRGCGKTTNRRVIEWNCRSGRSGGLVLAVPYTEFTTPLHYAESDGQVQIHHHIEAILRQGVPLLLDGLARHPDNIEKFTSGFRVRLAFYLARFTDLLTDSGLDRWLQAIGHLSNTVNAESLRRKSSRLRKPFLRFLTQLLTQAPEAWNIEAASPIEWMRRWVDLVSLAGYHAVYVLVDRVDEREPLASDPERAASLLGPLVTNLHLMELERTAFKIFITPEIMSALQARPGLRLDRLIVRDVHWSERDLQRLLDRRVEVFSQGALPSLDAVCGPDLVGLVSQIASKAHGSPRNMLRIAEWLLHWHHARVGARGELLLILEDFERAIISFEAEQQAMAEATTLRLPRLRIDESGKVWRGDKNLGRPRGRQAKLLEFLYERRGQICAMDEISEAVYGPSGASDEMIGKLVQRLRKRIEIDSSHPQYVVKAANGYVLERT